MFKKLLIVSALALSLTACSEDTTVRTKKGVVIQVTPSSLTLWDTYLEGRYGFKCDTTNVEIGNIAEISYINPSVLKSYKDVKVKVIK